jgi:hypothetical protein
MAYTNDMTLAEIYEDEQLCKSYLALRQGTPMVDPINGVLRLVRMASDEWECHNCGFGDIEEAPAIGYRYCDSSEDYDIWKSSQQNQELMGDDPICCWCADCAGCLWACPKCGHGTGACSD